MEAVQTYEQQLINRYAQAKRNLATAPKSERKSLPKVKRWGYSPAPLPEVPFWFRQERKHDYILLDTKDEAGQSHRSVVRYNSMPKWKQILDDVSKAHSIPIVTIIGACRSKAVVAARHEAAWIMHTHTKMSMSDIGRRLGGRDHTTIISALGKFRENGVSLSTGLNSP